MSGEAAYYGGAPHLLTLIEETEYYSLHFHWNRPSPIPEHPAHGIRYVPEHTFDLPADTDSIDLHLSHRLAVPSRFPLAAIAPSLERIVKEYKQEKPGYPAMLRALLMEGLTLWLRQTAQSAGEQSTKIGPAVQALSDHPQHPWSVPQLAALCGYHPIYFSKLFREEMGIAPKTFLIQEKIKKAKQLLLEGMKLETIAEQLQYGSLHYFSHHFKKETGLTPTQFRLQGGEATGQKS